MPRKARLDAPGTLHHIIIRGIEHNKLVDDDKDQRNFGWRSCPVIFRRQAFDCDGAQKE